MTNWKRFVTLAGMTLVLAACGNEATNTGDSEASTASSVVEHSGVASSVEANANVTNENFLQVIEIIRSNGFDISEPAVGDNDVKGAKDNVYFNINEEDLLPFQVFEMEPGDENLQLAKDSGNVVLEFEGMEGEVPADLVNENYIFFLPEGHPDRDDVLKALEEEFRPE